MREFPNGCRLRPGLDPEGGLRESPGGGTREFPSGCRLRPGLDPEGGLRESPGGGMREFPSCLLYTSPSPRDATLSRMPSSA